MRKWMAIGCLLAWVPTSGLAGTDRAASIQDVTVVENVEGEARVLFRTSVLPASQNLIVQKATLTIPHSGEAQERTIHLRVHPVTEVWAPGGDFNTDFDADLYAPGQIDLGRGTGTVTFDVTVLLKAILEEGMFADGFVLTSASEERAGIDGADAERFSSMEGAELHITTAMLPSGHPRGEGRE
jgi:hypothetical protein